MKHKLFINTPRKLHADKLKTARRVKLIQLLMRKTILFRLSCCKLVSSDWYFESGCGERFVIVDKLWRRSQGRSFNGEIIESNASMSHLHLAYYHPKYANHSKRHKWWVRTRFYWVSTDASTGQQYLICECQFAYQFVAAAKRTRKYQQVSPRGHSNDAGKLAPPCVEIWALTIKLKASHRKCKEVVENLPWLATPFG